jgi:hypothetical protein
MEVNLTETVYRKGSLKVGLKTRRGFECIHSPRLAHSPRECKGVQSNARPNINRTTAWSDHSLKDAPRARFKAR